MIININIVRSPNVADGSKAVGGSNGRGKRSPMCYLILGTLPNSEIMPIYQEEMTNRISNHSVSRILRGIILRKHHYFQPIHKKGVIYS